MYNSARRLMKECYEYGVVVLAWLSVSGSRDESYKFFCIILFSASAESRQSHFGSLMKDDPAIYNLETDPTLLPEMGGSFGVTDTIDMRPSGLEDEEKITQSQGINDLDRFIGHLADACPLIAYDEEEARDLQARYIMGKELGSGAIGQVIEAHDAHLSRVTAIKILRDSGGIDRDRIARFIAEAQITAQLEHPTIVPVHEIGRMPGGMPYFTMKTVRGKSLSEVINELRILTPKERKGARYDSRFLLRRFVQLCFGVAYAHSKGVVHRDLKPDNIMIGEYGEVQIMDWGLAKVMRGSDINTPQSIHTIRTGDGLRTLDGSIAGTPSYMSPEQARGEQENIGPCSDIFALGLLLAEILTLVRVFREQGHPAHLLQKVRGFGPVELDELAPGVRVAKELEAIVRKCTMLEIADRYQQADDIADDVRAYLENREISAEPDQTHKKLIKWTLRNPLSTGIAIGLAFAAILAVFAYLMLH